MGWVEDLHGKVVAIDTAPFIYYIEKRAVYVEILRPFFHAVDKGEIKAVTSVITLLETLVQPYQLGNVNLAHQYREILFNSRNVRTILFSQTIAEEAARLRAFHTIRTPDAMQMATAVTYAASVFLTNDKRLPSLPGLQLLVLDELKARLSS